MPIKIYFNSQLNFNQQNNKQMISKSSHLILLGLLLVLLASRANCDFNVDDIFTVVSATSNSTSNSTTTNCTANDTNCSSNSNSTNTTNTTNGTNTSAFCTYISQRDCVITEWLIIQFINSLDLPVFIDSNGNIIRCPAGCLTCTSATNCSLCEIGYALNSSTYSCVPCKGCKTCDATDPSICLSCFLPQVLSASGNGTCDIIVCTNRACQTCSDASTCLTCYQGYSLHANDCKACIQGCKKCTASETNCDSDGCGSGYVYLANSQTGVNECVQCSSGCDSCKTDNTNFCVGCIDGYYPKTDDTQSPVADQCYPCLAHCKRCSSSTSCTKCFKGYKLTSDGLRCVSKCHQSCNTCEQNKPKKCLSCFGNDVYNAATKSCDSGCNSTGTCISCPSLTALVDGFCNKCTVTDANCDNCQKTDLSACTSCVQGYYLSPEASCTSCPSECTVCLTQYACSSCKDGYYLSTEFDQPTGNCLACEDPCKTCTMNAQTCTSCPDGFVQSGTKCTGKLNVSYFITFDFTFSQFSLIFSRFILHILGRIRLVSPHFGRGRLCHRHSRQGSTMVAGTVSPGSSTDAAAISSSLDAGLVAGSSIAGAPILSSSVSVNGAQTSTSNLGLILGVSIPLIVLVAAILIFIAVKLSKDQKYKEYEDVDKNSLSNKEQEINNV